MLIFVESNLKEAQIPEIWETEEEKGLSIGDLKKKYLFLAQSKFIRNPPLVVMNKDKNLPIELSRRVISEWRIKSRTRERVLSIQLLDKMMEGAHFIKTVEDTKRTAGIENVSYYENRCWINGRLFKISITVKKQKSHDRRFAYYYSATESAIQK